MTHLVIVGDIISSIAQRYLDPSSPVFPIR